MPAAHPEAEGFWTLAPAPAPRPHAWAAAGLAAGLALPVYLTTMNRTIGFIDRGELAAAACTFGIPHSPGYPTLMLMGGAFARLLPLRPVLALNVLAALLVAASVAVLVLVFDRVLARAAGHQLPERARATYAFLGAAFVAVTMTWWQQANGFEVYALHALMMPLVMLLCLRWLDAAAPDPEHPIERPQGRGFLFALVTGLSFTNHLTTVLLAPALLVLAVARLGLGARFLRQVLALAPGFLLGLLPYAWLPLRSRMEPRFDWGGTHSLAGFLHHVTGADYRGWMFADPVTLEVQARFLAWRLPSDLLWIGAVIAAIGLLWLARHSRALALAAGLLVATGAAFAAGYRIMDLESYLLTSMFGCGVLFTAGLAALHRRGRLRLVAPLAAVLVVSAAVAHWRECDESHNRLAESQVRDLLGPLPDHAVYLTTLWDYGQSASLYFQEIEGFRADVLVASPQLLRLGWYYDELERRAPELVARAQPEGRRYRAAVAAVEAGRPYDLQRAENEYLAFLNAFAARAMRDRAVLASGPMPELDSRWQRVPYQLVTWLRPDTAYVPERSWQWAYRPWRGRQDVNVAMTSWLYGGARMKRADYEAERGDVATTRRILDSIVAFDPGITHERLGPQPLGAEELIRSSAEFFEDLRRTLELADRRAAREPGFTTAARR